MEEIGKAILDEMASSPNNRLFCFYNSTVDQVSTFSFSYAEEIRLVSEQEESRLIVKSMTRLGGGGINCALSAAATGRTGVNFIGFVGELEKKLLLQLLSDENIRLPTEMIVVPTRFHHVREYADRNVIETTSNFYEEYYAPHFPRLLKLFDAYAPLSEDWIALSSFDLTVAKHLLGYSGSYFLDTGYGKPRAVKKYLTGNQVSQGLISYVQERQQAGEVVPREFIFAANHSELQNICVELGIERSDLLQMADSAVKTIAEMMQIQTALFLHHSNFSTFMDGRITGEFWLMPSMQLEKTVRRTNAGDTAAGAFLAAYTVTRDPKVACFLANAAAGLRVSEDQLPTRDNLLQFFANCRTKNVVLPGARTILPEELKRQVVSQKPK